MGYIGGLIIVYPKAIFYLLKGEYKGSGFEAFAVSGLGVRAQCLSLGLEVKSWV